MDSPSAPPSLPTFEQESVQGSFFLSLVITTIGTPFLIIAFLLLSRFVEHFADQCTPQLMQSNSWAWHRLQRSRQSAAAAAARGTRRARLQFWLHDAPDARWGMRWDLIQGVMALISVFAYIINTYTPWHAPGGGCFDWWPNQTELIFEIIFSIFFSLDYMLNLFLARERTHTHTHTHTHAIRGLPHTQHSAHCNATSLSDTCCALFCCFAGIRHVLSAIALAELLTVLPFLVRRPLSLSLSLSLTHCVTLQCHSLTASLCSLSLLCRYSSAIISPGC